MKHGKFQDLEVAPKRTQDQKSSGEANKLEFESRGLAEETLDVEFHSLWLIMGNGMAIQEREVPGNVTVQTQEFEDATHYYKTVEATVEGIPITNQWKTIKARRISEILPILPDTLTGRFRIMPTTPTHAEKNPRYTGPSRSAGPLEVNR